MDLLFCETVIIKFLFHDPELRDRTIHYLTPEIFDDYNNSLIITAAKKFFEEFEQFPSINEMKLELPSEECYNKLIEILNVDLSTYSKEYLLQNCENFIKQKLTINHFAECSSKLKEDKYEEAKPFTDKIRESLGFTFNAELGLDFLEDEERIYNFLHKKDSVVPFGIDILDFATKGGAHEKSLNFFLAECVEENTKVKIRIMKTNWEYLEVPIKEVKQLLKNNIVQVSSPDGWVGVKKYIEKGIKKLMKLTINNRELYISKKHLYETNTGWVFAKDLKTKKHAILMNDNNYHAFNIESTSKKGNVVDITVDHPNHRYFTDGVSSHNTNLGKTMIMCSCAASNIMRNKKVLYITCEMAEDKISERVLANIWDHSINELDTINKEYFHGRFVTMRNEVKGNLQIKEFPPSTINANNIRNLMKEYEIKKKFKPDIIYLDYLELVKPIYMRKADNSYSECKRTAEEVRAVAVDYAIPVVSALQTNRDGFGSAEITLKNTADSIGLAFTGDLVIAITQPQELVDAKQFFLMILKNRYGENKVKGKVGVIKDRMRIINIDQDKTNASTLAKVLHPAASPNQAVVPMTQQSNATSKEMRDALEIMNETFKDAHRAASESTFGDWE